MNPIQKLVNKNKLEKLEMEYDDTMGLLTKSDLKKLRDATLRPSSVHRRRTYSTWTCQSCSHSCFFRTLKCQICGDAVIETVNKTKYLFNYMEDEYNTAP